MGLTSGAFAEFTGRARTRSRHKLSLWPVPQRGPGCLLLRGANAGRVCSDTAPSAVNSFPVGTFAGLESILEA
jgi:hypothetical protein